MNTRLEDVRRAISNSRSSLVVICVVIAVVYYGAAHLGLLLAFQKTNASPVWPPSGIAFAALLLFGKRIWPGIFLGAFSANFFTFAASGAVSLTSNIVLSSFIGTGNTLEALAGLWLLRALTSEEDLPFDVRGMLRFIVTVALMCAIASVVGATTLVTAGLIDQSIFANIWFTWWLGDAVGILTLLPIIVTWTKFNDVVTDTKWWRDFIFIMLATGIVSFCVFWEWLIPDVISSLPYLVVPLMFWSAFRFGLLGGAVSISLVSVIAVIGTVNDLGGFSVDSTHTSLLLLQTFIFIVASTTLLLAAAIEERNRSDLSLRKTNLYLEQQKAELEASNQELEAFSYSISHDLRSPLRTIDGFSSAVIEDYGNTLNEEAKKHLNRIQSAALRMGEMINDVLQLSKVNQMDLSRGHVDLTKMAETIFNELKHADEARNISLTFDKPLYANVDPILFRIALGNLIGNSWKYTASKAEAHIEIGERFENGQSYFYIKDNGIGFSMQNVEKLFYVFQRLHNDQIEGTGIGLAIVARIIKRHGGKIWGEGVVGKGAEFRFTVGSTED